MIAIGFEWSGDFGAWAQGAADRAADLTPLAYRLRRFYATQFKDHAAKNPIGDGKRDTGALDASLAGPSIFRVYGATIEAGTDLGYASYYAEYRRNNGLAPLLPVDGKTLPELGSIVVSWITEGRT